MTRLTTANAPSARLIRNIEHPEWGVKRFNYNDQPLPAGAASSFGSGCNSAILFESDFHRWEIIK